MILKWSDLVGSPSAADWKDYPHHFLFLISVRLLLWSIDIIYTSTFSSDTANLGTVRFTFAFSNSLCTSSIFSDIFTFDALKMNYTTD